MTCAALIMLICPPKKTKTFLHHTGFLKWKINQKICPIFQYRFQNKVLMTWLYFMNSNLYNYGACVVLSIFSKFALTVLVIPQIIMFCSIFTYFACILVQCNSNKQKKYNYITGHSILKIVHVCILLGQIFVKLQPGTQINAS